MVEFVTTVTAGITGQPKDWGRQQQGCPSTHVLFSTTENQKASLLVTLPSKHTTGTVYLQLGEHLLDLGCPGRCQALQQTLVDNTAEEDNVSVPNVL